MPIIDPTGLFQGQRLRRCSDKARLYWPYLFLASDGYARIELDYHALVARIFVGFQAAPSEEEFTGLIREYWDAYLLFLYQVDNALWGQWDCPDKFLPRHKTRQDRKSPKPPDASYRNWISERKRVESEGLQKLCGSVQNISRTFAVSRNLVRGEGGLPTPTPSPIPEGGAGETPDYDPSELTAWLIKNYPAHRQRGPWQYALSDLIEQDHAASRNPGETEARIRSGLVAYKRSQQWREGRIENLAKWISERLFMNPPPENDRGTEPTQSPASHRDFDRSTI